MWLQSSSFATMVLEDFVLAPVDASLQATIPIEVLQKLSPTFPADSFSTILVEIKDEAIVDSLISSLIRALEPKGILVVSIGDLSPNEPIATKIIDCAVASKQIVIPPLMVRYKKDNGNGYAFRFKKNVIVEQVPVVTLPASSKKKTKKKNE